MTSHTPCELSASDPLPNCSLDVRRLSLLDFALNRVHEAFFLMNARGCIIEVNEESCRALEYQREQLQDMSVFDIDENVSPAQWEALWSRLMAEHSVRLETRHRSRSGRCFDVEVHANFFEYMGESYSFSLVRDISERKHHEAETCRHQAEFRALAENSPDTIARYDSECRRLYVNPAFAALSGISVANLLGKRPSEYAPTLAARSYETAVLAVFRSGVENEFEYIWPTHASRMMISHIRLTPEFNLEGQITSVLAVGRDITALKESEQRLQQAEAMAHIGHWQWDYQREESRLSAEVCRIFGQPRDWTPSLSELLALIEEEDRERIQRQLWDAFAHHEPELAFSYRIQGNGGLRHLHSHVRIEYGVEGEHHRLVGTTQDVSELKNYESRLHEMAFHDTLTGLPNRALLNDRLRQSLTEATRRNHILGLLVLDLDRFKEINDSHGHGIGDHLLYKVAQRLTALTRDYDTVARLGGDEFALVLPEVREAADLGGIAQKILGALASPIQIEHQDFFISASIGIAVFPTDGTTTANLLQYADSALYDAKNRGRAGFRFYSSELTAKSKERAILELALRHAEPEGQLELYYQPKINLADGTLVGAEALLRWHHPSIGTVSPDKFISIAEDTGLIIGMGAWVLTKACLAVQSWNQQGGRELKMAVNLSSRQFRDDDLLATVRSVLALTGCEPRWLELEITESLLLDNNEDIRLTLQAFRELGISIAIDDFGTGYSALGYLKRFPIDVLKIDRSFTNDVTIERDSTELVKAIITMAHSLRLELVAEGIENTVQERFLQDHGCHLGQGYLYSKPIPRGEFESLALMHRPGTA